MTSTLLSTGRTSPILRAKGSFIKNELPPFRVYPAEQGRGPYSNGNGDGTGDDEDDADSVMFWEEEEGRRKRAVTMRSESTSGSGKNGNESLSGNGASSSRSRTKSSLPNTTTTSLGIGRAPLNSNSKSNTSNQSRSSSSRLPASQPNGSSSPRSTSLNMLSTSPSMLMSNTPSRLGVAAHFVPPESTYTPPKGADWDEVVLPTVAKKLGLTAEENKLPGTKGDEGDLAIEWDRDGTPVKWVKAAAVRRLGGSANVHNNPGLSNVDYISNQPSSSSAGPASSSAFSPTFDISPENPLATPTSSHSPLRSKRSGENIELAPIRTSSAQTSSLPGDSGRTPSPAPFSTTLGKPLPQGWRDHHPAPSGPLSMGHEPSLSKKQSYPTLPKKQSQPTLIKKISQPTLSRKQSQPILSKKISQPILNKKISQPTLSHHPNQAQASTILSGQQRFDFDNPRPAPTVRQTSSSIGTMRQYPQPESANTLPPMGYASNFDTGTHRGYADNSNNQTGYSNTSDTQTGYMDNTDQRGSGNLRLRDQRQSSVGNGQQQQPQRSKHGRADKKSGPRDHDEVDKGCGCIVM
ncbi:hypothetical protein BCR39DRAFT_47169 [Naematelia encephala]|uniref:Uncharacterized protein n=1 Tax=Naematelia encephala TaxID=71784 RepID=A0A1Y2BBW1_9TREE|nr:hypothetical protein BCR39DRAFT_47169 [Naematelia encephala]